MNPDYRIEKMEWDAFAPFFHQHRPALFPETLSFPARQVMTERELEAVDRLNKNMGTPYKLTLGLYKGSELVGWSFGWQTDRETYYMTNSAVLPEHRRLGLYNALLKASVETVTEEGFQIILSRHTATNNAILIPKLKYGFIISSMEICDVIGVLVHLRYYTNPKRRLMMDVRSGEGRPDDELMERLKLKAKPD